jgi:hypothetical protein
MKETASMSTEAERELTTYVSESPEEGEANLMVVTPIVVDLGKIRRKHVKLLKQGEGRLVEEVLDVLDEVVEELGDDLEGSSLVPIVMIYERKPKKRRRSTIELPF